MSTTTPSQQRGRSKSPHSRSRPTTPLRPSSRSSLRDSSQRVRGPYASSTTTPLELLQDDFAELSDAMADLESNFMQLQVMHESLARFSESFAAFLYGLNMNAFCVDFPEAPIPESFTRPSNTTDIDHSTTSQSQHPQPKNQDPNVPDVEATFLTTDTSFVENPPSSKAPPTSKFSQQQAPRTPGPAASKVARGVRGGGGIPRAGARGGGIPTRGGIPRGSSRGGSGIARGTGTVGRGRGRGTGTGAGS